MNGLGFYDETGAADASVAALFDKLYAALRAELGVEASW